MLTMGRSPAITEDIRPFPTLIPGPAIFLGILCCTVHRCPYCKHVFRVSWGPSASFLGCGEKICTKCQRTLMSLMSFGERSEFLLPIGLAGYLAAFLLLLGILLYAWLQFSSDSVYPVVLEVLAVSFVLWFVLRSVQVLRSIHRYNQVGTNRRL